MSSSRRASAPLGPVARTARRYRGNMPRATTRATRGDAVSAGHGPPPSGPPSSPHSDLVLVGGGTGRCPCTFVMRTSCRTASHAVRPPHRGATSRGPWRGLWAACELGPGPGSKPRRPGQPPSAPGDQAAVGGSSVAAAGPHCSTGWSSASARRSGPARRRRRRCRCRWWCPSPCRRRSATARACRTACRPGTGWAKGDLVGLGVVGVGLHGLREGGGGLGGGGAVASASRRSPRPPGIPSPGCPRRPACSSPRSHRECHHRGWRGRRPVVHGDELLVFPVGSVRTADRGGELLV